MKILFIEACDLHLGYLGCYGNDWIETPNLDRLAAESVVFDQHYLETFPEEPAGVLPCRYGLPESEHDDVPGMDLGSALAGITVREITGQDWEPTIEAACAALDRLKREATGLVRIHLPSLVPPWQIPEEFLEPYFNELTDEETEDEATAEDEEINEEPLTPWLDPPRETINLDDRAWERLQTTYAAVVSHADAQLGALLNALEERKLDDQVMLIFTASRGLALGEHGIIGACRPWLHEELIHLPLLMRLPGRAEAGRRVFALTQSMDLLPTLLAAFDRPIPDELHGHNLMPLVHGAIEKVRDYACTGMRMGERIEWALRTREWSFLLPVRQAVEDTPRPLQLYVKPDDRWEVNNLIQHHLELTEQLEKTLRAFVVATRLPGKLAPPPLLTE